MEIALVVGAVLWMLFNMGVGITHVGHAEKITPRALLLLFLWYVYLLVTFAVLLF